MPDPTSEPQRRRRRLALAGAGIAGAAVVGGIAGRAVLRRRNDPEADEQLSRLPPEDLGPVTSFDGTEIAVRAAGDPEAPIVLFVHGFSLDLTTWHYQWTGLSDRFRCVLYDQRWHGRSGRPPTLDMSLPALSHDLAAVIDSLPAGRRVVIAGHSMGGMTILALAESRPELFAERIAGAVFVATAASEVFRGAIGSVGELLRPRLGSVTQAVSRVNRVRRAVLSARLDIGGVIARLTQFGPDASPHLVDHVVSLAGRAPSEVWTDGLAAMMEMDLRHAVAHVTCPALVVAGELDRVTPPSLSVALAGELPAGRLELVENAGHMLILEAHEQVNTILAGFTAEALGPKTKRRARRTSA